MIVGTIMAMILLGTVRGRMKVIGNRMNSYSMRCNDKWLLLTPSKVSIKEWRKSDAF